MHLIKAIVGLLPLTMAASAFPVGNNRLLTKSQQLSARAGSIYPTAGTSPVFPIKFLEVALQYFPIAGMESGFELSEIEAVVDRTRSILTIMLNREAPGSQSYFAPSTQGPAGGTFTFPDLGVSLVFSGTPDSPQGITIFHAFALIGGIEILAVKKGYVQETLINVLDGVDAQKSTVIGNIRMTRNRAAQVPSS